jgi:PAS domain S-box-containing protein
MTVSIFKKVILHLLIAAIVTISSADASGQKKEINIGVLANRPKQIEQVHWQPLADYLSRNLPGYSVKLQLATNPELEEALANQNIDFIITNPTHYIQQRHLNSMSGALATIVKNENGLPVSAFGGVIVTLSKRMDMLQLKDLKGKRIAAVSSSGALGGYGVQAYELLKSGLKIPGDCTFLFMGQPQDQVINAVLDGKADAGFVRTGLIEQMTLEGKLDPNRIRIMNRQDIPSFPYALSTRLYPEWPFVALPHVDEDLARKVSSLLLGLDHDTQELKAAGIHGFTIPAQYEAVENMMRDLRMPPYDQMPIFSPADIWKRYRLPMLGFLAAALIIILLSARLGYSNRKLSSVRKSLQKSIEKYDDLVTRIPSGVYIFSIKKDGSINIDFVSSRFRKILGIDPETVICDLNIAFASLHPDDSESFMNSVRYARLSQNLPYRWEGRAVIKGDTRWISLASEPTLLADGGSIWNGVLTDITDKKKAENLINELNADLEQQVRLRTKELEHSNRELAGFCYAISHELRGPVARLKGFSEALREDFNSEADRKFCADRIDVASKQLQTVIDSILMLSRLSQVEMNMCEIDLTSMSKEIIADLKSHGEGAGASVFVHEGMSVTADPKLLRICLLNLIGNAFKYSSREPAPHVEIGMTANSSGDCFFVCDNGAGFDMQYIDKLFVPFQRLHQQEEFPGTGIGLATVLRIIERHGGKIWAEAIEGKGATFRFTLGPKVIG